MIRFGRWPVLMLVGATALGGAAFYLANREASGAVVYRADGETGLSVGEDASLAPAPVLDPAVAALGRLPAGTPHEYPVTVTNPSNRPYRFCGANGVCGSSVCLGVKPPDDEVIPPGGSVRYIAHVLPRQVGDFDNRIHLFIDAGGVLKTVTLRATGTVVATPREGTALGGSP